MIELLCLDKDTQENHPKFKLVLPELLRMGKLVKSLTTFEVKNLSSSALGDNELKFFQTPGIISIDMMKVIQRENSLSGYKLDNVSAHFIKEKANKYDKLEDKFDDADMDAECKIRIYTKSTKALEVDSYIQIMVDDIYSASPLNEHAKYHVIDIGEKSVECGMTDSGETHEIVKFIDITIVKKDLIELDAVIKTKKIFWTFAKDDMHHTLINSGFKEGKPKKIARIAKYCLKDCMLVNLLFAKLDILVNSMGMAIVCHVPLSYSFLRGQGVKILSLVSKKCQEKNYMIPVLRKKKTDLTGDDAESYEGATVITPKPSVYVSPISVLDYSSLYPNSMRESNLTPECYLDNPKFDNLPGYIYHDIEIIKKDKKGRIIKNLDGTSQKEFHRFAQKTISEEEINERLRVDLDKIDKSIEASIMKLEEEREELISKEESKKKIQTIVVEIEKKIQDENDSRKKKKQKLIFSTFNQVDGQYVEYGILPEILSELLNARKTTKDKMEEEKDEFIQKVLNSLQLAYKVTANSLYGQTGAPTSAIFFMAIAHAQRPLVGRDCIMREMSSKKTSKDRRSFMEIR